MLDSGLSCSCAYVMANISPNKPEVCSSDHMRKSASNSLDTSNVLDLCRQKLANYSMVMV